MSIDLGLQGRVIAVTGASSGFGRAIAIFLAGQGAEVHVADRDPEGLARLTAEHPAIRASTVDLADRAAGAAWITAVEAATGGPIAVLVNNAGGSLGQVPKDPVAVTDAEWDAIIDVNLHGVFALCRAVVPGMRRAGGGRIVNIGSRASQNASLNGVQAYTAAKHAIAGLTRQLAADLGPSGIAVNCVAPGLVRTNRHRDAQWERYGAAGQQALLSRIALRRLGTPEDIAHVVGFLASDLSAYVTGAIIPVDGGVT